MQRKRKNTCEKGDKSQRGYILVAVMLMMALMLIALSVELPRVSQQIKREKEEELVHRGREYAIAIKRYYHKTGTYPVSLDQLESTNNLRFLRRRFKDPMTESGEFRLVHVGEAQITIPTTALNNNPANNSGANTSASGSATSGSNSNSSGSNSNTGGFNSGGLNSGGLSSGGLGSGGLGGGMGAGGLGSGNPGATTGTGGVTGTTGTNQPGGTGTMGTLTTQNIGNGTGIQGGPQIIGVASTSKKTSIKEFNQNDEYDQWLFVYDPRVEQAGAGGIIIASPGAGGSANSSAIPQPVQPVRTSPQ